MKALLAALLSAVVVACGEGRAIFNVDIHSFLVGTGSDTIPYAVPPGVSDTVSPPPEELNLPPGFGSSIVDSVRFTGAANLVNTAGTGTIGFRLYLDTTAAGTLNPSALAIDVPPTAVSGANTVSVPIAGDLSAGLKDLFTASSLWIRLEVIGSNGGVVPVTGDFALTALQLRVVFQDKIF